VNGRLWLGGLGVVTVVLSVVARRMRWTRGPYHPMQPWERVLWLAVGIGLIGVAAFAPFR
jgi:hypothetical protein